MSDQINISELIEDVREGIQSIITDSHNTSKEGSLPQKLASGIKAANKIYPEEGEFDVDSYESDCRQYIYAENEIGDEIKNMRMQLKKSYDLFMNAREALESISFEDLKNRIKDLRMYPSDIELDEMTRNGSTHEKLENLTKVMTERFRKHPGEFGDIPEISIFFRSCSQLQRGMQQLSEQANQFGKLETKVKNAVEIEKKRVANFESNAKLKAPK